MEVANDNFVFSHEVVAPSLDISGNVDIDGTLETDALTINGTASVPLVADHKLDGIEASADVTDTTNVTAAGALMDSELASIADVKALDQSVISGASPTFSTANFTDASNKRLMTDAQETILNSVESGATADQTAAEIRTLVDSASDSNVFTDADHSKLDGIESSADVTDSTNVNCTNRI